MREGKRGTEKERERRDWIGGRERVVVSEGYWNKVLREGEESF